ncbi:MAG: hypothetical protein PWP32_1452 [Methanothermobacter sp.]|jgi:hypothetical protein|uniref:Uncharacterized protein n=1 Tax=Methanothermobacter defluvii TaxID=49339 RepID=A0A371NDT0_9EURY|nr:hypothetical protein [Methanothermobacter sp.]MDN5374687.1 hypothetical protein [Methanothermobacter sp.]REE28661.1 hypothetical protein C7452_0681 [Methanothermobacter defluvii]BAZ98742.1 hypothetical protein tca_00668 [Methanothermobacter sp. EMTCatA1]
MAPLSYYHICVDTMDIVICNIIYKFINIYILFVVVIVIIFSGKIFIGVVSIFYLKEVEII